MEAVNGQLQAINRRAKEPVDMELNLYLVTQEQHSGSWSSTISTEKGGEIGSTIGTEINYKGGVPVASVETKGKIEVTGKYIHKDTVLFLKGKEDTELKKVSSLHHIIYLTYKVTNTTQIQTRYKVTTRVNPGQRVLCKAVAMQSTVDLSYQATVSTPIVSHEPC
jgi:hypothetical protein